MVMVREDGTIKMIRRRDRFSEMFAPELDVLKMAGPNELEKYNNLYRVNIDDIWRGGGMTAFEKKKKKNGNGRATRAFEVAEQQLDSGEIAQEVQKVQKKVTRRILRGTKREKVGRA